MTAPAATVVEVAGIAGMMVATQVAAAVSTELNAGLSALGAVAAAIRVAAVIAAMAARTAATVAAPETEVTPVTRSSTARPKARCKYSPQECGSRRRIATGAPNPPATPTHTHSPATSV